MNDNMRLKVFLSVGRTETPQQEAFVQCVTECLTDEGFEVVRAQWSSEQPLKPISRKMRTCAGTAIVAFERIHFDAGVEFRGSATEGRLENISLPTVWNQIEAAMAYTLGHPLLVVVQEGLRCEGLLEARYDWYVQQLPLDRSVISRRDFRGVLADWKERVLEARAGAGRSGGGLDKPILTISNPEALTVSQLIGALKPSQLWTIVVTVVTALAAVFVAAYRLGMLTPSRP
jgi:hypothetical protein